MPGHAVAFVKWDVFRPKDGGGGVAVYDYGSDNKLLHQRVADGGTLWLVTSTRRRPQPRQYHLAYKLVDCEPIESARSTFSGLWKYVVRARDWGESVHFGYNEATDTLRRLQFTTGRPMAEAKNMGLRLLSIPALTVVDAQLMNRLQHRIEHGRSVFLSYSSADLKHAERIEFELGKRDVSTSRDVTFLKPGEEWAEALEREVATTDCFVVLVSPDAATSTWVRREIAWALNEYEERGLVRLIIPVVLPGDGWQRFPELHRFERWEYPSRPRHSEAFDLLAEGTKVTGR